MYLVWDLVFSPTLKIKLTVNEKSFEYSGDYIVN